MGRNVGHVAAGYAGNGWMKEGIYFTEKCGMQEIRYCPEQRNLLEERNNE